MASKIKEVGGERFFNMEACQVFCNLSPQGWRDICKRLGIKKWTFIGESRSVFVRESDIPGMDKPTLVKK